MAGNNKITRVNDRNTGRNASEKNASTSSKNRDTKNVIRTAMQDLSFTGTKRNTDVADRSGYMGTRKKEVWSAEKQMAAKKAYAQSQGKGKFDANEEMRKRREAAAAQGKGKWNAEEEMKKRREAAAARRAKG